MSRVGRSPRRLLRCEQSGWALVEMLVVTSLLAGVLMAIFSVFNASEHVAVGDQERAQQIKDAETGVFAMTHELRQTYSLIATGPYSLEAEVYEAGQAIHVKYDCTAVSAANSSWGACKRTVIGASSSTTQIAIPFFTNTSASGGKPVFTYTTNANGVVTYIAVHVEAPAQGTLKQGYAYRITYDDGFYMRNLG